MSSPLFYKQDRGKLGRAVYEQYVQGKAAWDIVQLLNEELYDKLMSRRRVPGVVLIFRKRIFRSSDSSLPFIEG